MDNDQLRCSISGSNYESNSFSDRVHKFIASETDAELLQNLKSVVEPLDDLIAWFEGLVWELENHSKDRIRKNRSKFSSEDET